MDDLPDIIRSRVGPQVVRTMAEALDRIIELGAHDGRCMTGLCHAECPDRIATEAARKVGLLTNLAVVAG